MVSTTDDIYDLRCMCFFISCIFTNPHSPERASVQPVPRFVVEQHPAPDVHGVGALADNDRVFGDGRLHCLEHCEVVERRRRVVGLCLENLTFYVM